MTGLISVNYITNISRISLSKIEHFNAMIPTKIALCALCTGYTKQLRKHRSAYRIFNCFNAANEARSQ